MFEDIKSIRIGILAGLMGYSVMRVGLHNDLQGLIYIVFLMFVVIMEFGE